ncbi:MAG: P-type conjugative transfer protein VirB9 [Alphaproteobacteria bacterium]
MRHFYSIATIVLGFFLTAGNAMATKEPRSIKVDHRVRTIMYQPDQVYKFTGHYRYQSSIEFGPGEQIATISMGDSTGWMLNPSGNRLFLKPVEQDATTNMTLITDQRIYLFELHAKETDDIDDDNMIFIMRFVYPDTVESSVTNYLDSVPVPDLEKEPEKYNFNYTIAGTDEIAPIRIFDDGEFTYFEFRDKNAEVPAFYWVDNQGNENVINYRTRDDYIVVERVSNRFTLRHGGDIVCVFNEARIAGLQQ